MRFTKMQGLGNDYVYVNCFEEQINDPAALAVKVSDRHFGIGSDGLILVCPSEKADVRMRMFNADGSEAEMCGNGCRCVVKYAFDHKLCQPGGKFEVPGQESFPYSMAVETGNGVLRVGVAAGADGKAEQICINMGEPILEPGKIPIRVEGERAVDVEIEAGGEVYKMTGVSMGNPHVVIFVDDADAVELEKVGPGIENHEIFPNRTNVHFVEVLGRNEFKMATWERGSGITLACGTGACACGVAGVLTGRTDRVTVAHLPGGDLKLNWSEEDNCVYMTGPAVEVFHGEWPE